MTCLFYLGRCETVGQESTQLGADYHLELWWPSLHSPVPPDRQGNAFVVWAVMHYSHFFANRDYGVLLIHHQGHLVHRSVIFPRYFRFPFMAKEDLQIGDTWTASEYRGKGLATLAVTQVIQRLRKPGRRFWYVTEVSNLASIRVIEKAGFVKVGEGSRTKRYGLSVFGAFVIDKLLIDE
jgi:RimJ/RimL family protein N-acetyltransferase